jgi:glycosyltransferase involved in cell wall biosynthesis
MNILMFFGNHPLKTSGSVSLDLFNGFKKRGHNVKLLVSVYDKAYPEGVISMETLFLSYKDRVIDKLKRIFKIDQKKRLTDRKYHFHEIDEKRMFYATNQFLKKSKIKPDAIIVLFAKNFLNAKNIFELNTKTKAPVYWMMYDSAPLTGGCHYSWDCKGYQNTCGNCPGLFSSDPFDMTYQNLLYKKKYFDQTDISIVLASEWQYLHTIKSTLFKNQPIHKIFIAINPELFKPVPKEIVRKRLGIPTARKVIFFGANYLGDERKGMQYLVQALTILKRSLTNDALRGNILLLIAGEEVDKLSDQLPFEYFSLGVVDNGPGIASAYQATDLFVCPSIEDAGPSMINQSLMCGTPIVSFAQGVSLDLVISGQTGYRAKLRDSEDLAEGILSILRMTDTDYCKMKNNCREKAMELLHPDVNISRWLEILPKK